MVFCSRFDWLLSKQLASVLSVFVVIGSVLRLVGSLLQLLLFGKHFHLRIWVIALGDLRYLRMLLIFFNSLVPNKDFVKIVSKQLSFNSLLRIVFNRLIHDFTQIIVGLLFERLREVEINLILLSLLLLLFFGLLLPTITHQLAKQLLELAHKWILRSVHMVKLHRCEVALLYEAVVTA